MSLALSRIIGPMALSAVLLAAVPAHAQIEQVIQLPDGGTAIIRGGVQGGVQGGIDAPQPAGPRAAQTGTSGIKGRVVAADTGRPLRRALVRASSPAAGQARTTTTDADGRYELTNLPGGPYLVNASRSNYIAINYGQTRPQEITRPLQLGDKQIMEDVNFALPRGGVITGRVLDEFGEPVTDAMVAPMLNRYSPAGGRRPMPMGRSAQSNDIGEFRLYGLPPGDYYISATVRSTGTTEITGDRSGYSPTFYPSTPNPAEAQAVKLGVGQTVSELTIVLSTARTATLSGVVLDTSGVPLRGGIVTLMARSTPTMPIDGNGPIRADGTFTISGVVPGNYVLRSAGGPVPMAPPVTAGQSFSVTANVRTMSTAMVDVHGEDISGIVLAPLKPVTLKGRIVGDAPTLQMLKQGAVRVSAQGVDPETMGLGMGLPTPPPATVQDDLTFSVQALPGRMILRPSGTAGAFLKAVRYLGEDITDRPLEVKEGDEIRDIEIELTNRTQTVTGVVTDERGAVPPAYVVVLFAEDAERWQTPTRFVTTGRPDMQGKYTARALPPGRYYAAAVEYVEAGQWTDIEFLDRLRKTATRFSLAEGQALTLDLKLTTVP